MDYFGRYNFVNGNEKFISKYPVLRVFNQVPILPLLLLYSVDNNMTFEIIKPWNQHFDIMIYNKFLIKHGSEIYDARKYDEAIDGTLTNGIHMAIKFLEPGPKLTISNEGLMDLSISLKSKIVYGDYNIISLLCEQEDLDVYRITNSIIGIFGLNEPPLNNGWYSKKLVAKLTAILNSTEYKLLQKKLEEKEIDLEKKQKEYNKRYVAEEKEFQLRLKNNDFEVPF